MTSKHQFEIALDRDDAATLNNPVEVEFSIGDQEFTAQPPTPGQLAVYAAEAGSYTGLFNFLAIVLDDDGVDRLKDMLREGVDVEVAGEVVRRLIEVWSGRPTGQSSGSSASAKRTGSTSTAKRRQTR